MRGHPTAMMVVQQSRAGERYTGLHHNASRGCPQSGQGWGAFAFGWRLPGLGLRMLVLENGSYTNFWDCRAATCRMRVLTRASGSAQLDVEGTSVVAAVHGPLVVGGRRERPSHAVIEVILKPVNGRSGTIPSITSCT